MDEEIVGHFIEILRRNEQKSTINWQNKEFSLNILKTYIQRGFFNMISTLKDEYINFLKSKNLAKPLVEYLVKVSGNTTVEENKSL